MSKALVKVNKEKKASSPLTDISSRANKPQALIKRRDKKFKFAMTGSLDNNFCFKKMKQKNIVDFHKFIDEILSKQMTITEVDKLFLRTKGKVIEKTNVFGELREIQHYGKDQTPFRIHGYFNNEDYFVIYQIDPGHKKHKA